MNIFEKIIKRFCDLLISLVGCIFLIPIIIILKICYIIVGDGKKIIFKQRRIGQNGKDIYIYKFRTMVFDADKILEELLDTNYNLKLEYSKNKKLKNDPRVTKIGKILRKTSIDELPQLINVLKGDLSLVGPRPYLHREIPDMDTFYDDIIKVKPGLTGLWQVSGRSNIAFSKRCEIESEYAKKQSLLLDTKIFFKTFLAVLKKDGAD